MREVKTPLCMLLVVILFVAWVVMAVEHGTIMYREDSDYLMEVYDEEIRFVESVIGKDIKRLNNGAKNDIMDVVGLQLMGQVPAEPDLQSLRVDLSEVISRYKGHLAPLCVEMQR